jgi:hypothetical protein
VDDPDLDLDLDRKGAPVTRSLHLAALASLLLLAACAADAHGDLRTRVAIDRSGAPARLTFDGVGIGSPRAAAAVVFHDDWLPPESEADFGTRLTTLWRASEDGSVAAFALDYRGNPVALWRLAARWEEVFRAAGVECDGPYCEWTEDGKILASLYVERLWRVPTCVMVDVDVGRW